MPASERSRTREEVQRRLVEMMCEITRIEVAEVGPVADSTPCVGGALLTDSLDVLEFIVCLEREFGVAIRDGDKGREILQSLGSLTDHVLSSAE